MKVLITVKRMTEYATVVEMTNEAFVEFIRRLEGNFY